MKIDKVAVEEFLSPRGIYEKPKLTLTLDVRDSTELPSGQTVYGYDDERTLRVQGQKYSFLADLAVIGFDDRSYQINRYFRGRPWFEVSVNFLKPQFKFYIPLDRARKVVAKHTSNWELVVDDAWAVQGDLIWRLREKDLTCKAPKDRLDGYHLFCGMHATTEIRRADHYIPMCSEHHERLTREKAKS